MRPTTSVAVWCILGAVTPVKGHHQKSCLLISILIILISFGDVDNRERLSPEKLRMWYICSWKRTHIVLQHCERDVSKMPRALELYASVVGIHYHCFPWCLTRPSPGKNTAAGPPKLSPPWNKCVAPNNATNSTPMKLLRLMCVSCHMIVSHDRLFSNWTFNGPGWVDGWMPSPDGELDGILL